MDQTFNFRAAPVPLHRRVNRRTIAFAVAALLVVSSFAAFSWWVIDSERRSVERVAVDASTPIVGTLSGGDEATLDPSAAERLSIDAAARADVRTELNAAREAASGRATFLDAGPGHLAPLSTSLIFVDGPSAAPGVVSVASTRDTWGSAVRGPSGTCYLLRFSPGDGVTYGTGTACTGDEALTAAEPSW
jgi:hypothetical protein